MPWDRFHVVYIKETHFKVSVHTQYNVLLFCFSMLLASSNPEVIKISSVLDITSKVEEYYNKGYVVGAIHPILLPIGHRRNFPASHMYRVVLSRLKLR